MALTDKLTAIGDAVRGKTGESEKLTLDGMAEKIRSMPAPMQKITISGNISGLFSEKFIELYNSGLKDYIEFKDVTQCMGLIPYLSITDNDRYKDQKVEDLSNIVINFKEDTQAYSSNMFQYAKFLKKLPKLVNFQPNSLYHFFEQCVKLQEIPEDFYKDWNISSYTNQNAMFIDCYNLRKAPIGLLKKLQNLDCSSTSNYYSFVCFSGCHKLPEVLNFPFPKRFLGGIWENPFQQFVYETYSLSRFTFEAEAADIVHKIRNSITLDFTENVGYGYSSRADFLSDKRIYDAETYAALKNDPESWTQNLEYCKYNKTSAVETINSLPVVQKASSTDDNTFIIKFKGDAGSATDGGAINTMTEEEIAVATSKGWTVTLG